MKRAILIPFASAILIIGAMPASAQVAGSTTLGVTVTELRDVMEGWSAKRQILGQDVYNDKQERVGTVEDAEDLVFFLEDLLQRGGGKDEEALKFAEVEQAHQRVSVCGREEDAADG